MSDLHEMKRRAGKVAVTGPQVELKLSAHEVMLLVNLAMVGAASQMGTAALAQCDTRGAALWTDRAQARLQALRAFGSSDPISAPPQTVQEAGKRAEEVAWDAMAMLSQRPGLRSAMLPVLPPPASPSSAPNDDGPKGPRVVMP